MFTASDHNHQMVQYNPLHQFESSSLPNANAIMERKWKPNVEIAPNCPRCASTNTKFCYYNNYSLSQPRYFCKGCRRYWTKGGSLRNVPVGGGCRKNRRAKSAKRISENYNKSLNDRPIASTKAPCSSDDSVGPNGGSDIDLAVVFAQFLNESSSSHETELANTLNSTTPDSATGEANLNILELPQVFEKQEDDQRAQDFLEDDMSAYGLQALLSDEIVYQDALWSQQAEAETLPNFTWQPIFQLQDFDSFPADGQLKTSANVIGDNWSSFDLSGFEVFSRP